MGPSIRMWVLELLSGILSGISVDQACGDIAQACSNFGQTCSGANGVQGKKEDIGLSAWRNASGDGLRAEATRLSAIVNEKGNNFTEDDSRHGKEINTHRPERYCLGPSCAAGSVKDSGITPWVSQVLSDILSQVTQKRSMPKVAGNGAKHFRETPPDHALAGRAVHKASHSKLRDGMDPSMERRLMGSNASMVEARTTVANSDGFLDVVVEAATLATRVKSKGIREEWDICRRQIYSLLTKMKAEK